jgi:hypothetical protein
MTVFRRVRAARLHDTSFSHCERSEAIQNCLRGDRPGLLTLALLAMTDAAKQKEGPREAGLETIDKTKIDQAVLL